MTLPAPETISADGAACTIWRDAPQWGTARTAAVGAFRCDGAERGARLLREVAARLTGDGFTGLVGPMNGDTWHSYRLVVESDGSPPFPLEPVSGADDHAAFTAAGFAPISRYVSARTLLSEAVERERPVVAGLSVIAWDGKDAEALIGQVFDMSLASFARNAFYKPITRDAFLDLYRPIMPAMDRRFVFFARTHEGRVAGFLFAYPNLAEGPRPSTVVIKTYASGARGAGRVMLDAVHRSARDLGMTHAIHALMHVDNQSLTRSGLTGGKVFRRYALMGLGLG